jgi:hypothetical protein
MKPHYISPVWEVRAGDTSSLGSCARVTYRIHRQQSPRRIEMRQSPRVRLDQLPIFS